MALEDLGALMDIDISSARIFDASGIRRRQRARYGFSEPERHTFVLYAPLIEDPIIEEQVGEITFTLGYDFTQGEGGIDGALEESNCPDAIREQIALFGMPSYIYRVLSATLSDDMPQGQGLGEVLYTEAFEALAEKLQAHIIITADECHEALSTSRIAQGLWAKLARYQECEFPFAWTQIPRGRSNPSEEYTLFYEFEREDSYDDFVDMYEIDPDSIDPWWLARKVGIGITRGKEFYAGHLYKDELVSALFIDRQDCFSFDVVVDPAHQARGLGAELVDEAIDRFRVADLVWDWDDESAPEHYEYCVEVVNPHMKRLLERKGFYVYETSIDGNSWLMRRARQNPQNLPIYVNNLGIHTNAPIPLYHATTAVDAILREGFKTPDELPRGYTGLGNSGMGLISMTGDPRYAEAICVHVAVHARIGIGDLTWSDLMDDFSKVSPKRYEAIVRGTDVGKAKNLIRVLEIMEEGHVPVTRGMFGYGTKMTMASERYELMDIDEYIDLQRERCIVNSYNEYSVNRYTNPDKDILAELYNELVWLNDGTIENPVGDSSLWTRFLGEDLSILDQIAYVRADLHPGMRIVSRSSSVDMPSVFYPRSGYFSVDEHRVQSLKRGEDLSFTYRESTPTPLPKAETGLAFEVDSVFADFVPAEDYSKFAVYLLGENEFRLPAPRDQLTTPTLEGTALDILESLSNVWQGQDVVCFYPRLGSNLKALRDNLLQ